MKRAMGPWFLTAATLASWALAGRPLIIDDAEPVDPTKFELEAGLFYSDGAGGSHFDVPLGMTYGLAPHLEIAVGCGWHFDRLFDLNGVGSNESGVGDLVLASKWKFLNRETAWADQALNVSIKFPTASRSHGLGSGKADFDAMWILTRDFGESLAVDVNAGYAWVGKGSDDPIADFLHYGVAVRYKLNEVIEPVAEIAASKLTRRADTTAALLNTGLRWKVREDLTLDVAGGLGLTGDAPNWTVTAGLTWSF